MKRALAGSIVLAAALFGCGGKKGDAPGAASGTASGAATASGSGTGTSTGTASGSAATVDERCADPCRFLADTIMADVNEPLQKTCGTTFPTPGLEDCEANDYLRNCIYAHHGYTFKKAKWKDVFGKKSWYKARADFKESELSKVASQNIRDLKGIAATCRGDEVAPIPATFTASKVSKADLALVVGWFTQKAAGAPPIPRKLEADGNPATENEIKGWLDEKHLFTLESWTPINYMDGKSTGLRQIMVETGAPEVDCKEDEDCEGFEWITFEIDEKNQIVGLSVGAAACPLVYVEGEGGALTYEGEILRNLARAGREATQTLRLEAAGACGAEGGAAREVRVQLVEAKDELTMLDDVVLVVDGVALAPRACADGGAAAAAYCGDDARYHTLVRGQTLALEFDIPAGATCERPILQADGYYVPLLPTRTQR
jgi:hypothetical protein